MKKVLIGIAILLCILLFISSNNQGSNITSPSSQVSKATEVPTAEVTKEPATIEGEILSFVEAFNNVSNTALAFAEDFTPSDSTSSHYRHEFRLNAYSNAVGKSYTFNNIKVDITGSKDIFERISLRIYADNATLDQCITIVSYASPILDSDMKPDVLQKTINYLVDNKEANGYYYGNLGLLLLYSRDDSAYNLMLKTD